MKKTKRIVMMIALCFPLLLIQCNKDENKVIEEGTLTEQETPEISALINFLSENLGLNSKKIIYDLNTSTFIIDGDVLMPLEEARGHFNNIKTKITNKTNQRFNGLPVSKENSELIKVYIAPEVTSQWKVAIIEAISNWNTINSSINISLVDVVTPTSINVTALNQGKKSGVVATASYPTHDRQPGKSIIINTYYNGKTASEKVSVMTHEFGHCFGLYHTDDDGGRLIPCTPISEMSSIMFSKVREWEGFSVFDKIAISTLYPVELGAIKLYRFKRNGYYFYTIDPCEITNGKDGYVFDGDLGYLYSTQVSGTVPLYRSINGSVEKGHKLSKSQMASSDVILGYLYLEQYPGTTALYCYKNSTQDIYTTDNSGPLLRLTYGFVLHKIAKNGKYDGIVF
ncbi:M57 family metalloprotease [Flavobacterium sp. ACN6]|uniref:M57 family metalloprotease n=1 Tax=Flavobacterium sp. ACN6 TaxID=1920426 RepID=UPI000BB3D5D1|nr:M57 family metalloprotease [Flavobacterium sp. ACN6]